MASSSFPENGRVRGDYPHFRGLWRLVITVLLAAAFVPLLTVGGGMYVYGTSVLKQETIRALKVEVLNHRKAVDGFLQERVLDLRLLAETHSLPALVQPGVLAAKFAALQEHLPCFEDLGIIDGDGRHLAYVGPHDLLAKNYREAPWFASVIRRDVFISDVFLGFRNKPHFVIAVKQPTADGFWILRATVNTEFFQTVITRSAGERILDAFMVNSDGRLQTPSRLRGDPMGDAGLNALGVFADVWIHEENGDIYLLVWQEMVPWVNVVQVSEKQIYRSFHKARNLGFFALVLSSILIVLSVTLTTNYLVSRLETKKQNIQKLDQHLRRCSYLASSMELSFSFFREVRDAVSNIDVTTALAREKAAGTGPDRVLTEIDQIHAEADRIRREIDKFTRFIHPADPMVTEVDLNGILEDLLAFLDSEMKYRGVRVERNLQLSLPRIQSDPSRLHQVFQNLLLNAVQAIDRDGVIRLSSRSQGSTVVVTVADSGPGIAKENYDLVFQPLFTTRKSGTGLGLSVCRSILERLGGSISLVSEPGRGAAFQVMLPRNFSFSATSAKTTLS